VIEFVRFDCEVRLDVGGRSLSRMQRGGALTGCLPAKSTHPQPVIFQARSFEQAFLSFLGKLSGYRPAIWFISPTLYRGTRDLLTVTWRRAVMSETPAKDVAVTVRAEQNDCPPSSLSVTALLLQSIRKQPSPVRPQPLQVDSRQRPSRGSGESLLIVRQGRSKEARMI